MTTASEIEENPTTRTLRRFEKARKEAEQRLVEERMSQDKRYTAIMRRIRQIRDSLWDDRINVGRKAKAMNTLSSRLAAKTKEHAELARRIAAHEAELKGLEEQLEQHYAQHRVDVVNFLQKSLTQKPKD